MDNPSDDSEIIGREPDITDTFIPSLRPPINKITDTQIKHMNDTLLFKPMCDFPPVTVKKMKMFIESLDTFDIMYNDNTITLTDISEMSHIKLDILFMLLRLIESVDDYLMNYFDKKIIIDNLKKIFSSDEVVKQLKSSPYEEQDVMHLLDDFITEISLDLHVFVRNIIRHDYPKLDFDGIKFDLCNKFSKLFDIVYFKKYLIKLNVKFDRLFFTKYDEIINDIVNKTISMINDEYTRCHEEFIDIIMLLGSPVTESNAINEKFNDLQTIFYRSKLDTSYSAGINAYNDELNEDDIDQFNVSDIGEDDDNDNDYTFMADDDNQQPPAYSHYSSLYPRTFNMNNGWNNGWNSTQTNYRSKMDIDNANTKLKSLGLEILKSDRFELKSSILLPFVTHHFSSDTREIIELILLTLRFEKSTPGIINQFDTEDLESTYNLFSLVSDKPMKYDEFCEYLDRMKDLPYDYPVEIILRLLSRIFNVRIDFYQTNGELLHIDNTLNCTFDDTVKIYQVNELSFYTAKPIDIDFVPIVQTDDAVAPVKTAEVTVPSPSQTTTVPKKKKRVVVDI